MFVVGRLLFARTRFANSMISVVQFLDLLRRSGLVDSAKLDEALASIEADATEKQLDDVQFVASALVKRYLLTVWHVKQLLKKRYRGFFLRQYKILGHLGSGGMSSVYLAEHTLMQRRVAVKVLPRKRLEKSIYLERFIREAQAIASLDHPNIVRAYDIDHEGDLHYIVMEYFSGENLQKIIEKEGKITFARIVNILRQTANALAYAHAVGVIHRDVKPSNILVNSQGIVKILDLGLALLDERRYEGRITHIQEDTILGTADYLAPEQALDSHKVDARADIYSLGGVLYFCLTGHPPFPDGSVSKRLLDHQQKEPPSILIDRPDAPEDLILLCRKMMSKHPDDRQQSAIEVVHDFESWLIKYDYAEPNEFSPPNFSAFSSWKADIRFSDSTAIPEIQRGKLLQILHQMDMQEARKSNAESVGHDSDFSILGEDVHVNLLDSVHGSSMFSQTSHSGVGRSSVGGQGEVDDPTFRTLNEIEKARSQFRRQHLVLPTPNKPPTPEPTRTKISELKSKQGVDAWYRHVPVWFWTLFLSGYAAAIFLAGILATLLVLIGTTRK
ncbi:MAG: serine/threonine protein kinase [Planctomycetaceae bacterium]|jgi:serine/threonine protein kinase|nr:serine/threonine protein kinase [Planctomycetaceae bacterium]